MDARTPYEKLSEFDQAPVGYFTCNSDGLIIQANTTFLNLVGLEKEEVINKKYFKDFLSIGGKMFYETHYAPLLEMHGKVKEVSLELKNLGNKKIPVLINSIVDKNGNTSIIRSSVFDITQRRQFEDELIKAKKEAEHLSQELKAANKNTEEQADFIRQQNKSLQKLNNIKDKYFGIVAHDLKSPLQNLKSFIYLLSEHMEDFNKDDIKKMVSNLKLSVDNAINLADDLVTWGHSQMKQLDDHTEELLLEEFIKNIIMTLHDNAQKKRLLLNYSVGKNLKIRFDKYKLAFIIRNLLVNAIKFTPREGEINIKATEENGQIKISVSDTGVGMAGKQLETLFSGEEISTKGTEGETGSGLGLSMVNEFVIMNNGSIEVESELEKGSCFTVKFKSDYHA